MLSFVNSKHDRICICIFFVSVATGLLISSVDGYCGNGLHEHVINDTTGETRCCRLTSCPAGFQGIPCGYTGGIDTCVPCVPGEYQEQGEVSSEFTDICHPVSCSADDNILVYNPAHKREDAAFPPKCQCDIKRGFYGKPTNCIRKQCHAGTELMLNGTCKACPGGFLKSRSGYGPCYRIPSSDITESPLRSVPVPEVTQTTASMTNVTQDGSTVMPDLSTTRSQNTNSETWLPWVVAVPLVVLFVIITVAVILCYWYRRKRNQNDNQEHRECDTSFCHDMIEKIRAFCCICSSQGNLDRNVNVRYKPGDVEQGSEEDHADLISSPAREERSSPSDNGAAREERSSPSNNGPASEERSSPSDKVPVHITINNISAPKGTVFVGSNNTASISSDIYPESSDGSEKQESVELEDDMECTNKNTRQDELSSFILQPYTDDPEQTNKKVLFQ